MMEIEKGGLYRHRGRGSIVRVLDFGTIELTMESAVLYEHVPRDQHGTWVRPVSSFADGRFERVEETDGYGNCPTCGALGVQRERRPNGNDKCQNGHVYPSAKAIPNFVVMGTET